MNKITSQTILCASRAHIARPLLLALKGNTIALASTQPHIRCFQSTNVVSEDKAEKEQAAKGVQKKESTHLVTIAGTRNVMNVRDYSHRHPIYSDEELENIKIAHRNPRSVSDWVALTAVRCLRWTFDKVCDFDGNNSSLIHRRLDISIRKKLRRAHRIRHPRCLLHSSK
jgi:hypothetical protein